MLFSDGAGVNISCGNYCPIDFKTMVENQQNHNALSTIMPNDFVTNIIFNLFSYTIRFLTLFLCCR